MNHPDRSWITDPDPDHPKGTHPNILRRAAKSQVAQASLLFCFVDSLCFFHADF